MNFETSKNLGGIGALLMFLGVTALFMNQTLVFGIIEIIGGILIIGSLYSLAKFYKKSGIFTNALLGGIAATIGVILSGIVTAITLLPLETDLTYQIYPDWNGDPATLQNLTPTLGGNYDPTLITALLTGVLLLLIVFCVFAIIAAFFARRSLKDLATHSNTDRFATVGLILLIGAILSIILIGLLLIWISALILAITFFTMKRPPPTTPTPTETTPPTPA